MNIKGKVVLITGGARIGASVAESLTRDGAAIALAYRRSRESAEETVAAIKRQGGDAIAVQADLCNPDEIKNLVQTTHKKFGRLDVLINMASVYSRTDFESLTLKDWNAVMDVDARATYLASLEAASLIRASGGGRIINISDWIAASGRPRYAGYLPYYTAKSAVLGLTEALALELAPDILVNCIAPGPILPPPEMSETEIHEVEKATLLGRWGGAEEIAKAVKFLIETDFITGECIRVDGGRHLK